MLKEIATALITLGHDEKVKTLVEMEGGYLNNTLQRSGAIWSIDWGHTPHRHMNPCQLSGQSSLAGPRQRRIRPQWKSASSRA